MARSPFSHGLLSGDGLVSTNCEVSFKDPATGRPVPGNIPGPASLSPVRSASLRKNAHDKPAKTPIQRPCLNPFQTLPTLASQGSALFRRLLGLPSSVHLPGDFIRSPLSEESRSQALP